MVDCGDEGDDDFRNGGLTASSYRRAAAGEDCKRDCSWRSQCRNPCLRPCLMLLQDPGEMVVTDREELNWVIKGIS